MAKHIMCGYCGGDDLTTIKTKVGKNTHRMTTKAWRQIKEYKENANLYYLIVCPVCGCIVGCSR
jgi:hypothetical protein